MDVGIGQTVPLRGDHVLLEFLPIPDVARQWTDGHVELVWGAPSFENAAYMRDRYQERLEAMGFAERGVLSRGRRVSPDSSGPTGCQFEADVMLDITALVLWLRCVVAVRAPQLAAADESR